MCFIEKLKKSTLFTRKKIVSQFEYLHEEQVIEGSSVSKQI